MTTNGGELVARSALAGHWQAPAGPGRGGAA